MHFNTTVSAMMILANHLQGLDALPREAMEKLVLCLSPVILEEYRRVGHELGRQHPAVGATFEPVLTIIAMNAMIVDAPPLAAPVSDDPDDDMFLAAAVASRTPLIVSGDRHLLRVSGWRGVDVLTPRQFVDQHLVADS